MPRILRLHDDARTVRQLVAFESGPIPTEPHAVHRHDAGLWAELDASPLAAPDPRTAHAIGKPKR